MNDFATLMAQIRQHYLKALLASYDTFRESHKPSSPEVMFELQREASLPYRLYRADMAANVNGKATLQDVNPSTHLSFQPFTVEAIEGLAVSIQPVIWNDMEVQADVELEPSELEQWVLKWLDVNDLHTHDENGLQNVIHSSTTPEAKEGTVSITVDWGSAPVEALNELLQLLRAHGATQVKLWSSGAQ